MPTQPSPDKSSARYDLRREARGGLPPAPKGERWRKVFVRASALSVCVLVAATCWLIWTAVTRVRAKSARVGAKVVHLSPGISAPLVQVLVDEGEQVQAGQVLACLDDVSLRPLLQQAEAERDICNSRCQQAKVSETLLEKRLSAEVELAGARVRIAEARLLTDRARLEARREALPQEQRQSRARLAEAEANLRRLENGSRPQEVQAAEARLASARALRDLYILEVQQYTQLVAEELYAQYELEVRKTQLARQENAIREAELELELIRTGAREEEITAAAARKTVQEAAVALADAAVAEIAGLEAAVSIREAELEEAQAELRRAEANTVQLSVAREESRIAAGELAKAEAQVAARRAALEGLEVTSPVAGVVTRIYAKPGEFCNAGAPLVLVADAARDQWIDAYVSEKDALDVYPGQAAKVRVPAGTGPYLDAKVTRVGLHTESVDSSGRSGADLGPAGYAQAEQVWVRIVPNAPLPAAPAIGTTADAIIWIR